MSVSLAQVCQNPSFFNSLSGLLYNISSRSGLGKLFGSMCAVAGVLVLSLPIPIIAANFERFHKNHQAGEKAKVRKALLIKNKKENERNR